MAVFVCSDDPETDLAVRSQSLSWLGVPCSAILSNMASVRPWTTLYMSVSRRMAQRSCKLCLSMLANVFDHSRNTGLPVVISCNVSCRFALDFLKCSNVTLLVFVPDCTAVLQLWSYQRFVSYVFSFRLTIP